MDIDKIEGKIDRVAAGATEVSMGFGGVQFKTMMELMEFAKLMAVSGAAVPVHLRGNPGACLAICTKALRFGFDPFALAEHSYSMVKSTKVDGKWENVETIAYDSAVIHAIIEAHAPIKGRLRPVYVGEGDARTCTVSGIPVGETEPLIHESPTIGKLKEARGKNDDGKIKGSPLWLTKPDQQLWYDTVRDWCRKYYPEILMGWYDKDEFEEYAKAASAKDITPATNLKDRLTGNKGKGFHADNAAQLPAPSETPMQPITVSEGEPIPVGEPVSAEPQKTGKRRKATDAPAPMSEPLTRGFDVLRRTAIADVPDLRATILDELTDDGERKSWEAACELAVQPQQHAAE